MFISRSTHAQKGIKSRTLLISLEIAAISYMDAETLVFSDMAIEIEAVSSLNTETAKSSIMLQNESKCRLFSPNSNN